MNYPALSAFLSNYPPLERSYLRWTLNKLHRDEFMAFTDDQVAIIGTLHSIPYVYYHRLDDARLKDGLEMRIDYFDSAMSSAVRGSTPLGEVIPTPTSVYEVLLALAEKVYNEVISDHHSINDCFWVMVQNLLDINIHTNVHMVNPDDIREKVRRWMERENGALSPCPYPHWLSESLWFAAQKYFSDWG